MEGLGEDFKTRIDSFFSDLSFSSKVWNSGKFFIRVSENKS